MGVQIVLYQVNILNISVASRNVVHELSIIRFGTLLSSLGVSDTFVKIVSEQDYIRALPDILVVFFGRFARFD